MTNELSLPQRASVALGAAEHEKQLMLLASEAKTITEIKNAPGRDQCHSMMMTLKNTRVAIEKTSKAAREDATAFSKAVIAEERRLIAITEAEETRLQGLRDAWDAAIEAERQAKIEAERRRIAEIQHRIANIRNAPNDAVGHSAAEISAVIARLVAATIGGEFEEFAAEAQQVRLNAIDQLAKAETRQRGIEIEAEAQRQEAARLKAEREELARLRAESEARRKEDERKAAEERAKAEAELKAAREKQEAEFAAQRAEIARQQAERDAEAAAQAKAAKEAQDAAAAKLAEERAALESRLQEERDREQAAARQAAVLEAATVQRQADAGEAQAVAPSVRPSSQPTLRLGEICSRIAPLSISADGLRQLGFEPAGRERSAVLYHESDWPAMRAAMASHIGASESQKQAA